MACIMSVNGRLRGIPMPATNGRANMGLAIKSCGSPRNLVCLICLILPTLTLERAMHTLMGGNVIVILSIIFIGARKQWGSGAAVGQRGNAAVGKRGNAFLTTDGLGSANVVGIWRYCTDVVCILMIGLLARIQNKNA